MGWIEVKHRPDRLLQKSEKEIVPPDATGYIARVTIPTHKMLLRFLNQRLIGKKFRSCEELEKVLATWPEFAKENGLDLDYKWERLWIDGEWIAAAESHGCNFVIARIIWHR